MNRNFSLSVLGIILVFTLSAGSIPPIPPTPSVCDFAVCNYLPLIRQDIQVSIYEIEEKVGRDSYCWFLGDVMTTAPVRDVVVEVSMEGQKFSNTSELEATLPGQLNPFGIGTPFYFPCPSYFEARVVSWDVEYERVYRNATIVSVSYIDEYSGTGVTVEVRNDEARSLLDVHGVIWSADMDNGPDVKLVAASLAPGETVTFSTFLYGAHYNPNNPLIRVSVQGILQP